MMIGDRDKDVEAALHAGAHSLGVLWGFGSHDGTAKRRRARIIESPAQLIHTVLHRLTVRVLRRARRR